MRIAFVYDAVYPWIKGGAEKRIYEIGRRLADRGHEVHWFGVKWWECGKNLKNDGLRLLTIGKWDNRHVGGWNTGKLIYFIGKLLSTSEGGDHEWRGFNCYSHEKQWRHT